MLITLRCQRVKTQQGTNDACKPILAKEVTRREKTKQKNN